MTEPDPPEDESTRPLDPDEVACPQCGAPTGTVCTTPTGNRAKTVHAARRRAATGADPKQPGPKKSPGTAEGRSKGGRAAAERRAEDRATVAAIVGQVRADALIAAARQRGEAAAAWDDDRMALKRLVLDEALEAWGTLLEATKGVQRVQLDEDTGRPLRIPVERVNADGDPLPPRYEPDVRGAWSTAKLRDLATVAGITLDKVRLEEGSATSRHEQLNGTPGEGLAELGDKPLRAFVDTARSALDEIDADDPPSPP